MPLPALLADLALPVLGAPLFIISDPGLVVAQCRAGIVGAFPALNAQPQAALAGWLDEITVGLKEARLRGEPVAPYAVSHLVHPSNARLDEDMVLCARYGVPLIVTSLSAPTALVPAVHEWGGLVFHEVVGVRQARDALEAGVDGLVLVCAGADGQAGSLSPFSFLEEVRAFWDGPIVLAGAIDTGRSILAAQIIGADLAAVGRRFIATTEAHAGAGYRTMLLDAQGEEIVAAPASGGVPADLWPLVPGRREHRSGGTGPGEETLSTALVVARLRSEYYDARAARIRLGGATAAAVARPEPLPVLAAAGARR